MRFSSRLRRRSIFTLLAVAGLLASGGAIFSRLRATETRDEREIAPGISLLSVATSTPNGPLRFWLVKAQKQKWKLGLQVADAKDVIQKRSVRQIAKGAGAVVAINGGFFAYDGAAVGAVKVGGEWHRAPWKNRTALMWTENRAQIAPLAGRCELTIKFEDGTSNAFGAALNGFALAGTHTPMTEGFSVLTRRFGPKIQVKTGQTAWMVRENRITARDLSGEIGWPLDARPGDFIVVSRGKAALTQAVQSMAWNVVCENSGADKFAHVLGAGPRLVEKSRVRTTEIEEEFRPDVVARGPRTAVGFDNKGNTLFFIADGRQAASVGLTLPETAALLQSLGAVEAINLDGGSSTQLVINGELINAPSGYDPVNPLRPREVKVINAIVLQAKQ